MNRQIVALAIELDKKYPNNRELIGDLADLADCEVSEGSSLENELELMSDDVKAQCGGVNHD